MMMTKRPVLMVVLIFLAWTSAAAAQPSRVAPGNAMHPTFLPLDADGQPTTSADDFNAEKTCGACHDVKSIAAHDSHRQAGVKADCVQCHYAEGELDMDGALDENGFLKRERVLIHEPGAANCGVCHGVVTPNGEPVSMLDDFEAGPDSGVSRSYAFTRDSGAVYSGSDIAGSFLNIAGKAEVEQPWDAHAFRLLECTACHFAPNNPLRAVSKKKAPDHLVFDPRRLTTAEYLRAPDHRLATATCASCHDAERTHDFLPYKERHLRQLECESCHAASRYAPVVSTVDETVATAEGGPRYEYRNVEPADGESLNTALIVPYRPPLFALGDGRVGPRNPVTTWRWVDGKGEAVAFETVRDVYRDAEGYRSDLVSVFDADGDGALSKAELLLDTDAKIAAIRAGLTGRGVAEPRIEGVVDLRPVAHGVTAGRFLSPSCADCHATESRLNTPVTLATFSPGGGAPKWSASLKEADRPSGDIETGDGATLRYGTASDRVYIFGLSRRAVVDRLGQWIFGAVLFGVTVHGAVRMRTRHRRKGAHGPVRRIYLYTVYERLWHWFMALTVVVLLVTGSEIYYGGGVRLLGMSRAVTVHNVFSVLLVVNAFLSLFYHLASSAIRQFIPPRGDLRNELFGQVRYYLWGIFQGWRHPVAKSEARKLNPLQQITYMGLLNVLFPLQVATGALIWGVARWPGMADAIGGLTVIVPLHHLGSWLFVTFLFLHLYLTTTGHTLTSNIQAMIDGYDWADVEDEPTRHGDENVRQPQQA